uniref:Putative copia reverse transcriptase n=1 Tax=Sorghum bicolor TaxID=4558 RepID=Q1KSB2_SORBI|nr:putative copia reverse transcriptase [Sorghum bicolor]
MYVELNPLEEELCIVDSGATNSILREIKYFQTLKKREGNILTIAGHDALIVGSGRATITLPMGTQITIEDALLYPESTRTLLSFRDIHVDTFRNWHDRLGHPGIGMMRKFISNSTGHDMEKARFPQNKDFCCTACATGKLILRPSHLKIRAEPLKFLERIQGDICGPIQPLSGPFSSARCRPNPTTTNCISRNFPNAVSTWKSSEYFPFAGIIVHKECQEINWNAEGISSSDPRTTETELQVQRIIDLQNIANNLPGAFSNYRGVTKSLHLARNVPERVEVPNKTTHPQFSRKRGRSTSNRQDVIAGQQKKTENATQPSVEKHLEDMQCPMDICDPQSSSVMRINTEAGISEDPRSIVSGDHDESLRVHEITINFVETVESYNHKSTIVDIYFSEQIANILLTNEDPKSMTECKKRLDWDKWKITIETEITSLYKRKLIDVVTVYLYGSLDSEVYMKVPNGISIPDPKANRNMYCVKLQKSLYGLKQSSRMWYNRLSQFLTQKGYK